MSMSINKGNIISVSETSSLNKDSTLETATSRALDNTKPVDYTGLHI